MIETFILYFLLGSIVVLLFFAVHRLIDIASSLNAFIYWLRDYIHLIRSKGGDPDD